MNKEDLLKLKEMLKKDKVSTNSDISLTDNYILVWSKSQGTEEDCPIVSAEHILSNKKTANEVVDWIINNYIQAIYVLHYFGLDDYVPTIPIDHDFIYKMNKQIIGEEGYLDIESDSKTFGDVVNVKSFTGTEWPAWSIVSPKREEEIKNKIGIENYDNLLKLYYKLCAPNNTRKMFVSFDELITELSSRGFYSNYENFQAFNEKDSPVLYISTEPFVKENENVK